MAGDLFILNNALGLVGFDETFALVAGQNYELFVTVGDSFGTSGSWSFALVVPEPATGLLTLLGLVVLGARGRRPPR